MELLIFGAGVYYLNRKNTLKRLDDKIEICGFLDNDPGKLYLDDIRVYNPSEVSTLTFDKVLLMSKRKEEMREQLLSLGVSYERILDWEQFLAAYRKGQIQFYCGNIKEGNKKKILVLSTELNYNGGTIAAGYLVEALQDKGYCAYLAAETGDLGFVYEMKDFGINTILYPNLHEFGAEEMAFLRQFDVVIVNVFQMIRFAVEIGKIRPVLWWIHEPVYLIEETISEYPEYAKRECFEDLSICAVSPIPQNNFNRFFPGRVNELLPYGIPDMKRESVIYGKGRKKIVFAVVGALIYHKAQDVFLEAVSGYRDEYVEFWIVGPDGTSGFAEEIKSRVQKTSKIRILGAFSREEMKKIYADIDVLVCPSRADSLPIVCTEAMMYGKPVIVSDSTGTAHYIENGKNGFVCKTDDADDLREKIGWMINNPKELPKMGEQARKTYELYFSMDKFADRLEELLCHLFPS